MGEIKVYQDELLFSNKFLQRLQNPTDPAVDTCSMNLLNLFIQNYAHRKEELLALTEKSLEEANKFLTQELTDEDLGFNAGRHPSRTFGQTEKYLNLITSIPYIIFETQEDGKKIYEKLPLIKEHTINETDGKHKVVFNDMLIFHISPDKQFGRCSLSLLREISKQSVVAGILYQEGCRWQFAYNGGKGPYFDFSEKQLREKLAYDRMDFSKDMKKYETVPIKHMRIDKIRELVLKPALIILRDIFNSGKTDFYLIMTTFDTKPKKEGRPPKRNFHFKVVKEKQVTVLPASLDSVQLDMFDDYEEINNYTEITKELAYILDSKRFRETIIKQIQVKETDNPAISEDVLTKIRHIRTSYENKGRMQWRKILISVLWEDFGVGIAPKRDKTSLHDELPPWPDNSEDKIKAMQQNFEICDKAVRIDQKFTQEKVLSILGNEFLDYCMKKNKPLKDWKDATSLFFSVFNKPWFLNSYGYDKRNNDTDTRTESDGLEEEALRNYR